MELVDEFFAQIYKWNHRYVVETFAVIVLAIVVHIGYRVLSDRQVSQAVKATDANRSGQNLNIRDVNNFGDGSHTDIKQTSRVVQGK